MCVVDSDNLLVATLGNECDFHSGSSFYERWFLNGFMSDTMVYGAGRDRDAKGSDDLQGRR
jgi:hypothetical protein